MTTVLQCGTVPVQIDTSITLWMPRHAHLIAVVHFGAVSAQIGEQYYNLQPNTFATQTRTSDDSSAM